MVVEILNHREFSFYNKFFIRRNAFSSDPVTQWMLLGIINDKCTVLNYIADSDNEEELCVWADTHGIKVLEVQR